MAHETPAHASRFDALVDAIRRYLATHPTASDTVEGIAGWAVGAVASATADEVRSALTHLEARGEIARRRAAGGAEVYARTPTTKRAEADTFLLGVDLGGT